jgi:hypothetical protein
VLGDVTEDSGGMNKVILTPQAIDGAFVDSGVDHLLALTW